ncbi:MAG: dihydroorotate dehydrogenase-like protein [Minicystis sp.]
MDLSTTYLGLRLAHPIMPGASPMADDLDSVKRLEDAGAAAIVMRSLFEEQIVREQLGATEHIHAHEGAHVEALSYLPPTSVFAMGPDRYLDQIRRIRAAVAVPVIASLNGTTPGGWVEYARLMEQAGAHALELNLYTIPTDPDESGQSIEDRGIAVVRAVAAEVKIPVAVKLSPFYSSLPHFAKRVAGAGAAGVVLFNRFYQPDIDLEDLDVRHELRLSDSSELLLRLRWLAILSGRTSLSLAVSGGVHTAVDAVKALMTGAHAVQMVSALLLRGPSYLRTMIEEVEAWLEEHEYASITQLTGSMSLGRCPDPGAYERANYMTLLQSFHGTW